MADSMSTIGRMKVFLGTPERPVSMAEFKAFWEACTSEEKLQFKEQLPKE